MLSSRFLRLSDAAADHKTKERGFFHALDEWYTRRVNWAIDHSWVIIGISVITALLTIPLNRMVGREFVPTEDMGEWIVHVDAPEGTSLEGTTEVAFKLLDELKGIEGVADIEPSVGVSANLSSPTHIHFLCQALPIEERKNTQAQIAGAWRRIRATGRASVQGPRSEAARARAALRSRQIFSGPTSIRSPSTRRRRSRHRPTWRASRK
jgi:HAE1 family hydrophobic/amphiphilic exporter-1